MSGYYNQSDIDELNEPGNAGGGGLRKMLEESLAENKKLRELIEGRERGKSTADLLKDKGLDPAVAELIPSDQDPKEWVDKYAHLLGVAKEEDTRQTAPETLVADDSDPAVQLALKAEQDALAAMQDAAESGVPAAQQELLNKLDSINSEEELVKFFAQNSTPLGG